MASIVAPAFVRGRIVSDKLVSFGGRGGTASFDAPDPQSLLPSLPLRDPAALSDVHELPFDEIVSYLDELGRRLGLADNEHLQEALERSEQWADLTAPLMRASFAQLP